MPQSTGVLSIQGDFEKHIEAVRQADPSAKAHEVRTIEELAFADRLIIPGGESTTVGLLLDKTGLGEHIIRRVLEGMPIWGTCMGLILLSKGIEGRPQQKTLGLLNVMVRRNAFGAQVHSFEDSVEVEGWSEPAIGVFIRAPEITQLHESVNCIAKYRGKIVAARQGNVVGTAFHPELTDDRRFHRWFLGL